MTVFNNKNFKNHIPNDINLSINHKTNRQNITLYQNVLKNSKKQLTKETHLQTVEIE